MISFGPETTTTVVVRVGRTGDPFATATAATLHDIAARILLQPVSIIDDRIILDAAETVNARKLIVGTFASPVSRAVVVVI